MKHIRDFYCMSMPFSAAPAAASGIIILRGIQALSPSVFAVLTASIIDSVSGGMQGARMNAILGPLIALLFLILFQFGQNTLAGLLYTQVRTRIRERFDGEILRKISRLPYAYLEDGQIYELIHRIDKKYDEQIIEGFRTVLRAAGNGLQMVSILCVILAANAWQSAVMLVIFSLPLIGASISGGKKNYAAFMDASVQEQRAAYLDGVLCGKDAALERSFFGFSGWMQEKWKEKYDRAQRTLLSAQVKSIVRMKLSSMLTVLISIGVCAMFIPSLLAGRMSLGIFFGLTTAVFNFVTLVSWEIADTFNQLVQSNAYSKELSSFFSLEEMSPAKEGKGNVPKEVSVSFEHVSFRYPGREDYVLRDVSLQLRPNRHYALVGINGAGKTSLIKLLTGLYTQFEGEIRINGRSIRELSAEELRGSFSVAWQDFARYSIPLREYFSLGEEVEETSIWKMLREFDMDQVVAGLPEGLDTPMGRLQKEGQELSQGQWQRLMLARTLMCSAPVKIFDEPASAIDPVGESRLYDKIADMTKGELAIFITHRLGAAGMADEILVLDGGSITEKGTHEELMREGGLYAEMYETQKEWYTNA